jgi:sialidase-1
MLPCLMAVLVGAAGSNAGAFAAEVKNSDGDEPVFAVWDEEILTCSIVVAMDGSVLLFEEQREKGVVEVKRSEDGGKTWGEPIEVGKPVKIDGDMSDGGRYSGPHVGWSGLGTVIVDENTGDIMVFATSLKPAQISYRSRDHGKTWRTEDIVIKPDVNGWLSAPNNACDPGVTLRYGKKKGRLLVPSRVMWDYLNKSGGAEIFAKHYSNAIYSDDGGKTWMPSAPFPLGGTGEAGLAELRDGRIYYNSRTHMRPGNRRIAHSHDGGETWVDEHEDDELFDGPPDVYGCKAALLRLPYDHRDILVFSSPRRRDIRHDITVWASFDGGETWPVKRLVHEGPGNYTWLAAGRKGTSSEGMIYLAAGKDWMARFNLAWIMEKQDLPEEKKADR